MPIRSDIQGPRQERAKDGIERVKMGKIAQTRDISLL